MHFMTIELATLFDLKEGLNEKMVNFMLQAIRNKHESGLDYLRFKQSVKNLMAMNMDEVTAVKSAYATASTMGLDKQNLLTSILSYQSIVNSERDKFIETLKKQIEAQVDEPRSSIAKTKDQIATNEGKIAQLQKEISLLQEKIAGLEADITSSEEKIEKTRMEFLDVYETFTNSLKEDQQHFEGLL
jgi:chromosome segregation ATPase